ncbi:MAG: hypothetical protein KC910_34525 [Candidatus Eremiobacteraeota bacterium]|nr:hypothetical protein [Candidatus Eremiobacteraeota bacterium]
MQATDERPSSNGNSLQLTAVETRLQHLKAAAYDVHRQIHFLANVRLPELEQEIARLSELPTQKTP